MFNKKFEDVGPADIHDLIERAVSESDTIEFKRGLPGSKKADPWYDGGKLGDPARDKLLAEVIALTNSLGGRMVIGIDETDTSPPRAASICSIPRCVELADRLSQQVGACIEPQIPRIQLRGIPMEVDGSGVVIVNVERSPLAHRR